ncbi:MAG TPA: hypothetical protein VFU15_11840, partial [Bacteroidia bacterium]|nr:hypothetical protein [Bacteroidia bacterium]
IWPYHVSDLQWWQNAAAMQYQVFSIPSNFLIDGNGVIVAKNLRGEQLEKALRTLEVNKKHSKKRKPKKGKSGDSPFGFIDTRRRNNVLFTA